MRRIHRGRDVIIGVPFLNRSSDAELRTVGCMVNMLPLRIPVDSALSMAELADQITAQVWELQARQRFAYGYIVTALQDSAGTCSTLFDVTYSYLTIPDSEHAEWIWKDSGLLASGYSLDAVNIVCEPAADGERRAVGHVPRVTTIAKNAAHKPLSAGRHQETEQRPEKATAQTFRSSRAKRWRPYTAQTLEEALARVITATAWSRLPPQRSILETRKGRSHWLTGGAAAA